MLRFHPKACFWLLTSLAVVACGGAQVGRVPEAPPASTSALHVFAEGPCPKLSVEAAGARRFLVYGDHGRVLAGWMPGDRLATAESLAELRGGRVFRRPSLLEGLPRDARGYVPGELRLGGSAEEPWLVRTTVRYSLVKRGPLFERDPTGYRFDRGWKPTDEPVTVPAAARELPELPVGEMCGPELGFVPLAWTATPAGGLVVAGRCDDDKPANYTVTTLLVAHGAPHAKSWRVTLLPSGEVLGGIVNLSVYAAGDDDVYVSAYEPFEEPERRKTYLARFDGNEWHEIGAGLRGGIMSVTGDGRGTLWLAAGNALYRRTDREVEAVRLPALRFAPQNTPLHVHAVRYLDGELWVEASYLVHFPGERGSHWASALLGSRRPDVPIYCDVREDAENALAEAAP